MSADPNNQFICLEHGTHVKADVDGCCVTCGRDCLVIENGELHSATHIIEQLEQADDDLGGRDAAKLRQFRDAGVLEALGAWYSRQTMVAKLGMLVDKHDLALYEAVKLVVDADEDKS